MSKATENIAKLAQVAVDGSNLTPVGTVGYFPASTPPAGWLKANGALVSRTRRSGGETRPRNVALLACIKA